MRRLEELRLLLHLHVIDECLLHLVLVYELGNENVVVQLKMNQNYGQVVDVVE